MRIALVNPRWSFEGSIYFGCREPHLPLELGYSKALLQAAGHEVAIVDGTLHDLDRAAVAARVQAFGPDMTVVATAPSYLFWRCAQPELGVPQDTIADLRPFGGLVVAVGPHGSTTPRAALGKLGADAVVMGECEEILVELAARPKKQWFEVSSIAWRDADGEVRVQGTPHASDMTKLPALAWDDEDIRVHRHHHHRFDRPAAAPGAEIEYSRGCPYRCTFCAKENFRNKYRRRALGPVLDELDRLIAQGVEYVYFIDEIFMPDRPLLEALVERNIEFGVQLRIDLWTEETLELLGRAGCVSIEAGVESISEEGRALLDKRCKLSTDQLTELLIHAKKHVPFVQANLLDASCDAEEDIEAWRKRLIDAGVWANKPVPLFSYPGSPGYTRRWGEPDDAAWERAHEEYLKLHDEFSDVQESRPLPLVQLERRARSHG